MASNGVDPITGAKKFPEEDALQSGADLEEVDAHAVYLGTRPIGTTTERNSYPYAREGLRWYDTTLDTEFVHTGAAWVPAELRPLNAAFAPTRMQHGRANVTTDAGGYFTVTFPVAFPNACDRVIPVSADAIAYFGGFAVNGMTHLAFSARVDLYSSSFNVDWVAFGR